MKKNSLILIVISLLISFYSINIYAWELKITATGVDLDVSNIFSIIIGVDETANNIPSPPFPPHCTVKIEIIPASGERLYKNIQLDESNVADYIWNIALDPHGQYGQPGLRTAILDWSISDLNNFEGSLSIIDGKDGTGDFLVDMKANTSYNIPGDKEAFYSIVWNRIPDNPPRELTLNLQKNWNLSSFPLKYLCYTGSKPDVPIFEGTTDEVVTSLKDCSILEQIKGKYSVIRNFDANGAGTYDPNMPDFMNTLTYIAGGHGYWIKMNQEANLTISSDNFVFAEKSDELSLRKGWNLVGYWHPAMQYLNPLPDVPVDSDVEKIEVLSLNDIFCSINGKYEVIRNFDLNGAGTYDPSLPSFMNTLNYAAPQYAYWIKMKDAYNLHYNCNNSSK